MLPNQDLSGQPLQQTYRIERLIGAGSMGAVYEASHARLSRRFAVKVLTLGAAEGSADEAAARFAREAEVTSRLKHPNIVDVIDFNHTTDGAPFIVMELLEGIDLQQRLEQAQRLTPQQAAPICSPVMGRTARSRNRLPRINAPAHCRHWASSGPTCARPSRSVTLSPPSCSGAPAGAATARGSLALCGRSGTGPPRPPRGIIRPVLLHAHALGHPRSPSPVALDHTRRRAAVLALPAPPGIPAGCQERILEWFGVPPPKRPRPELLQAGGGGAWGEPARVGSEPGDGLGDGIGEASVRERAGRR